MKKGFTLVEIMIVVAIIGLLAAIAIPSFMRSRTNTQQSICINNLRLIEGAKDNWAIDNSGTNNQAINADEGTIWSNLVGAATGYLKQFPSCPSSSSTEAKDTSARLIADYTPNSIGTDAACAMVPSTHALP